MNGRLPLFGDATGPGSLGIPRIFFFTKFGGFFEYFKLLNMVGMPGNGGSVLQGGGVLQDGQ